MIPTHGPKGDNPANPSILPNPDLQRTTQDQTIHNIVQGAPIFTQPPEGNASNPINAVPLTSRLDKDSEPKQMEPQKKPLEKPEWWEGAHYLRNLDYVDEIRGFLTTFPSRLNPESFDPPAWILENKPYPPLVARALIDNLSMIPGRAWAHLFSFWEKHYRTHRDSDHLREIVFWLSHYPQLPPPNQDERARLNKILGEKLSSQSPCDYNMESLKIGTIERPLPFDYQILIYGSFLTTKWIAEHLDPTKEVSSKLLITLLLNCPLEWLFANRALMQDILKAKLAKLSPEVSDELNPLLTITSSQQIFLGDVQSAVAINSMIFIAPALSFDACYFFLNETFDMGSNFKETATALDRLTVHLNLHYASLDQPTKNFFQRLIYHFPQLAKGLSNLIVDDLHHNDWIPGPLLSPEHLQENAERIKAQFIRKLQDPACTEDEKVKLHFILVTFLDHLLSNAQQNETVENILSQFLTLEFLRDLAAALDESKCALNYARILVQYDRKDLVKKFLLRIMSRVDGRNSKITTLLNEQTLFYNDTYRFSAINLIINRPSEVIKRGPEMVYYDFEIKHVHALEFIKKHAVYTAYFIALQYSLTEERPHARSLFFILLTHIVNEESVKEDMEQSIFEQPGAYEQLIPLSLEILDGPLKNKWTLEDIQGAVRPGPQLLALVRGIQKSPSMANATLDQLQNWYDAIYNYNGRADTAEWREITAIVKGMINQRIDQARILQKKTKDSNPKQMEPNAKLLEKPEWWGESNLFANSYYVNKIGRFLTSVSSTLNQESFDPPVWIIEDNPYPPFVARALIDNLLTIPGRAWDHLFSFWEKHYQTHQDPDHLREIVFWLSHYPQLPLPNPDERARLNEILGEELSSQKPCNYDMESIKIWDEKRLLLLEYQIIIYGMFLTKEQIAKHLDPTKEVSSWDLKTLLLNCPLDWLFANRALMLDILNAKLDKIPGNDLDPLNPLSKYTFLPNTILPYDYPLLINRMIVPQPALSFDGCCDLLNNAFDNYLHQEDIATALKRLTVHLNLHYASLDELSKNFFQRLIYQVPRLAKGLSNLIVDDLHSNDWIPGPLLSAAHLQENAERIKSQFMRRLQNPACTDHEKAKLHFILVTFLDHLLSNAQQNETVQNILSQLLTLEFLRDLAAALDESKCALNYARILVQYDRKDLVKKFLLRIMSIVDERNHKIINLLNEASLYSYTNRFSAINQIINRPSEVNRNDPETLYHNLSIWNLDTLEFIKEHALYTAYLIATKHCLTQNNEQSGGFTLLFYTLLMHIVNEESLKEDMEKSIFEQPGAYEQLIPLSLEILNGPLKNKWTLNGIWGNVRPGPQLLALVTGLQNSPSMANATLDELRNCYNAILLVHDEDKARATEWMSIAANFKEMINRRIAQQNQRPKKPLRISPEKPEMEKLLTQWNSLVASSPSATKPSNSNRGNTKGATKTPASQANPKVLAKLRAEKEEAVKNTYADIIRRIQERFDNKIKEAVADIETARQDREKAGGSGPETPDTRYFAKKIEVLQDFESQLKQQKIELTVGYERQLVKPLAEVQNSNNINSEKALKEHLDKIKCVNPKNTKNKISRIFTKLVKERDTKLDDLQIMRVFEQRKMELLSRGPSPSPEEERVEKALNDFKKRREELETQRKESLRACDASPVDLDAIQERYTQEQIKAEQAFKKTLDLLSGHSLPAPSVVTANERQQRKLDYEKIRALEQEAQIKELQAKLARKKEEKRKMKAELERLKQDSLSEDFQLSPSRETPEKINNIEGAKAALKEALEAVPGEHPNYAKALKLLKQVCKEGTILNTEAKLLKAYKTAGIKSERQKGSHNQLKGGVSYATAAIHDDEVEVYHKVDALNKIRSVVLTWK